MSMQSSCQSVIIYFTYLLGSSAKSWHTEEINLQFLEQCKTVALEKRSQGRSGAAALCFPGTECFSQGCSCHMEVVENVIRSLRVHELNLFSVWPTLPWDIPLGMLP